MAGASATALGGAAVLRQNPGPPRGPRVASRDRSSPWEASMSSQQKAPPFLDDVTDAGLSRLARGLIGSEVLRIAAEVRALLAAGQPVCNLTVGDFDSREFSPPERLLQGIQKALAAGHTNYPPSNGVLELRQAVTLFVRRAFGLDYPVESVLVAGGARPLIYATYRALVDPGESVAYPVPSG